MKCTCLGLMLVAILAAVGCTAPSTKLAIANYEKSNAHQQEVFEDTMRVAEQQLFLAFAEYIVAHKDNMDDVQQAAAEAFQGMHEMAIRRVQFERGQTLSQVTVGARLYDLIGWGDTLAGNISAGLHSMNPPINGTSTPGLSAADAQKMADALLAALKAKQAAAVAKSEQAPPVVKHAGPVPSPSNP